MTSVGTPIYVAPEVKAGNHYDAAADSYSFGICLVAMIRGEKEVMEFYFQALRKTMKRKSKKGLAAYKLATAGENEKSDVRMRKCHSFVIQL